MRLKNHLSGMAAMASLLIVLGIGCASSPSQIQQPPPTSYTRSTVGTPDELSPLAPPEARNVRRVGGRWFCEVNGQTMMFNGAKWVPQPK